MSIQEQINNLPGHQQKKVTKEMLETAMELAKDQQNPVCLLVDKTAGTWAFDHLSLYFTQGEERESRNLPEKVDVSHLTQMPSGAWATKEVWAAPMYLIAPDGSYETTREGHWFLPFNTGHPGFHPKDSTLFNQEKEEIGHQWVTAFGSTV